MCRLAGYVGHRPTALASLLYDPPHSLEHAAYAPRELLYGTVNVDGTGVVWWTDSDAAPLSYVTDKPPWADPNLPGLAPKLEGRTVLATVRSATPGLAFGPANVAPFVSGNVAAVHNGWIGGFRGAVGRRLLQRLSDERHADLLAMNDSLALFLLVLQHLEDEPEATVPDAVSATIELVADEVDRAGEAATLNLVVGSASEIVAARTSAGAPVNSLYVRRTEDASWVASEPLDPDDAWEAVPEHSLVTLTAEGITMRSMEHQGVRS